MKKLLELVLELQESFLKNIQSEDDSLNLQNYLINLRMDCEFISKEVLEQPEAYFSVHNFMKILKEHNESISASILSNGLVNTTFS